ncbi:ACT domain-containing protein [Rubellimicrobium sp. CFH 75288]|uniref:ACT domain-containing protein n=1 Tax=Rubellimicrobium sp. CFH 75288 TaxID=2697034 RepID=UPI001412FFA3|nr:ACT domain-containing protein [Rubellimicrobium sp. CFH 75288]NAZ35950.1 ACT domain-containing protein [Rubellimicrobium sp. CFH 75288]
MSGPAGEARAMLAGMAPALAPERFRFCEGGEGLIPLAWAMVREAEGPSLILPEPLPEGAAPLGPALRRITLEVWSALDGVGLTAAVSGALAARGIACNVVAGARHDHLFVPDGREAEALDVLRALSAEARGGGAAG